MNKYVEIKREKLQFCGNTPEERKANELIYDLTLENDSLNQDKENLIKYLEDKIKELKDAKEFTDKVIQESSAYESGTIDAYQDILERVKSGKYE